MDSSIGVTEAEEIEPSKLLGSKMKQRQGSRMSPEFLSSSTEPEGHPL